LKIVLKPDMSGVKVISLFGYYYIMVTEKEFNRERLSQIRDKLYSSDRWISLDKIRENLYNPDKLFSASNEKIRSKLIKNFGIVFGDPNYSLVSDTENRLNIFRGEYDLRYGEYRREYPFRDLKIALSRFFSKDSKPPKKSFEKRNVTYQECLDSLDELKGYWNETRKRTGSFLIKDRFNVWNFKRKFLKENKYSGGVK